MYDKPCDHAKCTCRSFYTENMRDEHCRVNFDCANALLELPFVSVGSEDLAFEIFDGHDTTNMGTFMSLESPSCENQPSRIPLRSCFVILRHAISLCLPYAQSAEVYLTDSPSTEMDFQNISIPASRVCTLLEKEYAKVPVLCPFVPDLHISVMADEPAGLG